MTLRGRLLAALIALLALICLIVSSVTVLVLRRGLLGQIDDRLVATAHRPDQRDGDSQNQPGAPVGPEDGGPAPIGGPPDGSLYGDLDEPRSLTVIVNGRYQPPTTDQIAALRTVPADGRPHTVDLPVLGDFRVVVDSGSSSVNGQSLHDVNDTIVRLIITEVCVTLAGLIAVGLVGEAIIRRTLRPLNRVAATATRVSEMTLDRGEVALSVRVPANDTDPRTEVGQVGASLNRMLGHVATALNARQESETRVRQFVADASHELRTPLAAIRGYAELTRRMDGDVPPDVAHAMRRVESESARMTTLVDDLLLLARLDSGRPLDREPVDLTRLLVDAVSDAHVAGPDHTWRLDLPDDPVTVTGDAARLHQVFANLLANARTHTPPGTAVTVGLSTAPDPARDGVDSASAVHVKITDDGPGIPAEQQATVFERFARGDTSRSRAAGSTGLGLAIVAAVVEAHHGAVAVDSAPGHTEFTVTLPAA